MSKDAKAILGWLSLFGLVVAALVIWITCVQLDGGVESAAPPDAIAERPTPTDEPVRIVFDDGIPTAVAFTSAPTPTNTPRPTNTPMPTATTVPTERAKTPTQSVSKPKPTNTPKPTATPTQGVKYSNGVVGTKTVDSTGHAWKPWARHTAVTDKKSSQYRLEQIAKTDDLGRRVVKDENGEWRFLVALPVYWAGGSQQDIGRCVDIKMVNGRTLKCVLADVKKVEHSINGKGMFGSKGEIIEVICDQAQLAEAVRKSGDASGFGGAWVGEIDSVTVLDMFIKF